VTPAPSAMRVRLVHKGDVPVIYQMLCESAAAQGASAELCVTPADLLEDGFRSTPTRFGCLIAEAGDQPAGLALYHRVYSTWTSRSGLYLEDLYVAVPFRRQGVARALMTALANIAVEAGCLHLQWMVLRANTAATRFYESIGAEHVSEWMPMRIEREDLRRLARDPEP